MGIWTEPNIEALKTLWAENKLSCTQIANELGQGFSRNSVIGKVHRLGLGSHQQAKGKSQGNGAGRAQHLYPRRKLFRPAIVPPAPSLLELAPLNLTLLELQFGQCRFPVNEESPFLFCGHPQACDSSYCGFHHRLTHNQATEAQREAGRQNAAIARRTKAQAYRAAS